VATISVSERARATVSEAQRWTEPDKLGERRASTAPERPAGQTCVQDPAPILLTGLVAVVGGDLWGYRPMTKRWVRFVMPIMVEVDCDEDDLGSPG